MEVELLFRNDMGFCEFLTVPPRLLLLLFKNLLLKEKALKINNNAA